MSANDVNVIHCLGTQQHGMNGDSLAALRGAYTVPVQSQ